jgi:ribonuclease HII
MAKVVSKLNPDISYVDSCDVNPIRFGREISKLSDNHKIKSYHHADSRFVVVSAASILAKVTRDGAITKLRKDHDLGSGYPSDRKTVKFATKFYKKNQIMPSFMRKSWKPVQRIVENN